MITLKIETENLTPEQEKEFGEWVSDFGIIEEAFYEAGECEHRHVVKNVTMNIE